MHSLEEEAESSREASQYYYLLIFDGGGMVDVDDVRRRLRLQLATQCFHGEL